MSAPDSLFIRACQRLPVETTPVWFMRQAGRYMQQYRDVRKHYSLVEICKKPDVAAAVTITAAEFLKVDAAIIFADLLLPLEVMGLPFHFAPGEGPVIERPIRTAEDVKVLRTDRAAELGYVADAVALVTKHFGAKLPVIGFCGAPFTLASYMVEGGGSRHYLEVKKLMYNSPEVWDELVGKLVDVLAEYAAEQVRSGADALQIFDSWVGCLSVEDYRRYALVPTTKLIQRLQKETKVPIIYFGTDSATLLPSMAETGAEVIGLDWRIPLDEGWHIVGHNHAVQGNLDPVLLFASWRELQQRAEHILRLADARPGHIFNLGHGILPHTPVDNVKNLAQFVHEFSATASSEEVMSKQAVLLIAHGSPECVEDIPEFLQNISRGRPMSDAVVREVQHRYSLIGVSPLTCMTVGQANGVSRELGIAAYVGMRNWHPFIADTLKQMTADGVEQAVAICLAPHNSQHQCGPCTSRCCWAQARRSPSTSWKNGTIIRC
jgi:uroporphyrinogen decarboxylase